MRVDLYPLPTLGRKDLMGKTAVVIDALRATSSMVTAVQNGCREIVPVSEVTEAIEMAARLGRKGVLLCGERGGLPISGFDLSNSPLEYTPERVAGMTLVMTTTNGTQAVAAVREGKRVLIGSFLNASAVAKKAMAFGDDLVIVCAGTQGRYSSDDVLAAGAILAALTKEGVELSLDDMANTARKLYEDAASDLHGALSGTTHYEKLRALGMGADLDFCLRLDAMDSLPVYAGGVIRADALLA